MIKTITLKFGRAPGIAPEAVHTTPITVFVGPNNSGKSRVLQELNRFFQSASRSPSDLILDYVELQPLSHDKADAHIQRVTLAPQNEEAVNPDHILVGREGPPTAGSSFLVVPDNGKQQYAACSVLPMVSRL